MSDADLTLDPLAGALPIEPKAPEPTSPEPAVPEPATPQPTAPEWTPAEATGTEPAGDVVDGTTDIVTEDVVGAEPITADPVTEPAPPPVPQLSAEELAAIVAAAPTPTAEELASLAAEAGAALPSVGVVTVPAATDVAPVETQPAKPKHTRRRRLRGWVLKLATTLVAFALFVGGLMFGMTVFQRVQPPPPLIGDPSTGGIPTPAVVKELVNALASNDADALRSAVPQGPYELLTGELQSWQIQGVNSVDTLATMQDGTRSATEIVVIGKAENGNPVVLNLVVQVDDNQIVSFR